MRALDLIKLTPLMERTSGRSDIVIGMIDGPVIKDHPDLAGAPIREMPGKPTIACVLTGSIACQHGTFVAGILSAKRDSPAPAICPNCTLLVRPIFTETPSANGSAHMPSAKPDELAGAILECINAGANVLNLSAAIVQPTMKTERDLEEALDQAARRGVIVVVAAGNQGMVGSTAITRHPWVVPVVAYDLQGRPMAYSNLGSRIGSRGLGAPGEGISSLGAESKPLIFGGTSAAAPFVTGAIALLWSEFPAATAAQIKLAISQTDKRRRATVVPPLLDTQAAYQCLCTSNRRRRIQ